MPGPDLAASSSVARPISAAVGTIPAAATKKISTGSAWASSSTTASGMNGVSRYGHPWALIKKPFTPPRFAASVIARRAY